MNLKGKYAVVAGGLGLLGLAIAKKFDSAGAKVSIIDLAETESEFQVFRFDIANRDEVKDFFYDCERLDVFVNAAYPSDFGPHAWGFLRTTCEAAKKMADQKSGVIINVASIYGHCGPRPIYGGTDVKPPSPGYSMVKGGIIALTRHIARRYGRNGVRAVSISPGGIYDGQPEDWTRRYNELVPLGRMGMPEDVANLCLFLASDSANYITGIDVPIDGGFLA